MKTKGILLTILLTSGLSVRGEKCPDAYMFEPCRCNEWRGTISVSCSDITSSVQLQKVIDNTYDYRFDKFKIERSNLAYLNATWLAQKQTNAFELEKVTLVDLFYHTPTTTLPSLENFKITSSRFQRRLRWSQFKPFVRLRQLEVYFTEVKKLGKSFRENVSPELEFLDLADTKFSRLEERDFEGKRNLKYIHIIGSGIKILKNSFFKDQKASLISMDFSTSPIESLPDDLFQGFQALEYISLYNSKIKTLSAFLFQHAPSSLTTLEIADTPLICDCKMKWITARRSFNVIGTCDLPPPLKSKNLMDLTEKDFTLCARRNALPFNN